VTGDGRGHIEANGRLCDDQVRGNALEFRLDFDQTNLPPILGRITEICRAYPVVGRVDV